MGHDEDKNNFDTGGTSPTPVTPNPRATITSGNRLGMRTSRNVSAAQAELDRISADSNPNAVPSSSTGDITLTPSEPKSKSNKKIFLLIGLAIVAVVIFVVNLFISKNIAKGGNSKAEKEYISSYLKLIQYGDSEIDAEISLNMAYNFSYIHNLAEESVTDKEKTQFAHALDDMSGKLGDSLTKNQPLLKMIKAYTAYLLLDEDMDAIEKAFIEGGEEAARSKYSAQSEETPSEESGTIADRLNEGVIDYKDAYIKKMKIYAANGCIKDNTLIAACRDFVDQNAKTFGIYAINRDYTAAWLRIEDLFEEGSKYLYEKSISYYREGL